MMEMNTQALNFISYWRNVTCDTPTYSPEWLKLKRQPLSSVGEVVWFYVFTADGCVNWYSYEEHSLMSSAKVEDTMQAFDLSIPFQVIHATEMSTRW